MERRLFVRVHFRTAVWNARALNVGAAPSVARTIPCLLCQPDLDNVAGYHRADLDGRANGRVPTACAGGSPGRRCRGLLQQGCTRGRCQICQVGLRSVRPGPAAKGAPVGYAAASFGLRRAAPPRSTPSARTGPCIIGPAPRTRATRTRPRPIRVEERGSLRQAATGLWRTATSSGRATPRCLQCRSMRPRRC